jgi:hypothetical protein
MRSSDRIAGSRQTAAGSLDVAALECIHSSAIGPRAVRHPRLRRRTVEETSFESGSEPRLCADLEN